MKKAKPVAVGLTIGVAIGTAVGVANGNRPLVGYWHCHRDWSWYQPLEEEHQGRSWRFRFLVLRMDSHQENKQVANKTM